MTYFQSLSAVFLVLSIFGCREDGDRDALSTAPAAGIKHRESLITHFDVDPTTGAGRVRALKEKSLPTRDVDRLRPYMNPEHSSDPRIRAWYASVKLGEPAYAVSEAALPENAAAIVIRDPGSPTPRLIVISQRSVDDVVLGMARHALRVSETGYPTISHKRTIVLWADQRFRVTTEEGTRQGNFEFSWLSPDRHKISKQLLARATGTRMTALPGIGSVRTVPR